MARMSLIQEWRIYRAERQIVRGLARYVEAGGSNPEVLRAVLIVSNALAEEARTQAREIKTRHPHWKIKGIE